MKQSRLSILAIMVILLTASCSRGVRMSRELAAIDSLTNINPDSALVLLGQMDTLSMRHADRMCVELLRGKAMNKAFVDFTTDSTMLQVVRYFDRHGDANQRMLAHYVLGCAYRDMGSAPRALEQYQQAAAQADTTSASCDLSTLMRVHSQMLDLYTLLRLHDREIEEASEAENLCWKLGDTLSAMLFKQQPLHYLFYKGDFEECIKKTLSLYRQYLTLGETDRAALLCNLLIKCYLETEDYQKAKHYLDIYASCSYFKTDTRKIIGGAGPLFIYLQGAMLPWIWQSGFCRVLFQNFIRAEKTLE